ncbi:AMP-dependent synthetase [Platysternon megacephalum]|uniref:AMP-dependent synthetase n=1 Tax=Platysternon megacephalum TaxID=55544 RepID=A0A4D9DEW7_9SAUR|nr:AMP-dependent synthetase [Platysternon megacephalum]
MEGQEPERGEGEAGPRESLLLLGNVRLVSRSEQVGAVPTYTGDAALPQGEQLGLSMLAGPTGTTFQPGKPHSQPLPSPGPAPPPRGQLSGLGSLGGHYSGRFWGSINAY